MNERFLLVHTQIFYCCYSNRGATTVDCISAPVLKPTFFVSFIKIKFIWVQLNDTALSSQLVSSLSLLCGAFSLFTGVLCVCVD